MFITVECECGEIFDIDLDEKLYRARGTYDETTMGKMHCPNPDCNKTVYVNANVYAAVALDEDEKNPKVYWDEIELGQQMKYDDYLFEVAFKHVWTLEGEDIVPVATNLLYLRSFGARGNLILEVRESGYMSLFNPSQAKYTTHGPMMWTEEGLKLIKEKEENKK